MRKKSIPFLITFMTIIFSLSLVYAQQSVRILTASRSGEYYQAAKELNKVLSGSKYRLNIQESPGSFGNIDKLGNGRADLALAQFDAIMLNILMGKKFKKRANNCEVIAPLNFEYIHIIVNKNSKINSIQDLMGKRIAVGPSYSGSWVSAFLILLTENNIKFKGNRKILTLPYSSAFQKVANGQVDAMFITIMPGASLLKNISSGVSGKLKLLSLGNGFKLKSKEVRKYYIVRKVAAGTYPWQSSEAYTLATPSFLLAYKHLDTGMVSNLTRLIFDNAATLNKKSKLWKFLDKFLARKQIKAHVPYHVGAKRIIQQ